MSLESRLKKLEQGRGFEDVSVNDLTFVELMHPQYFHCEDKVKRIHEKLSSMTREERANIVSNYRGDSNKLPTWTLMDDFYAEFREVANEVCS